MGPNRTIATLCVKDGKAGQADPCRRGEPELGNSVSTAHLQRARCRAAADFPRPVIQEGEIGAFCSLPFAAVCTKVCLAGQNRHSVHSRQSQQ